jgi:MOSC domain-containing protein YiiM
VKVERVFIKPRSGEPQVEHAQVTVVAGSGIEGDRYFGRHEEPGQNLTLVEAEEIEAFLAKHRRPQDLSITSRNVVTRGVRLNELVGREFYVGEVKLRGVELCEPCRVLGTALASPDLPAAVVVKQFAHRAGIRADVLTGGTIGRGAVVKGSA